MSKITAYDAPAAVALLGELVTARGSSGQEEEVAEVCRRELGLVCDEVRTDPSGNVIGAIAGGDASGIRVLTHMDELSMIVKRVNGDGTLRVDRIGGMWPTNFGQGPVEIFGDGGVLPGVLSLGCMHISRESARIWRSRPDGGDEALDWDQMFIFTGRTADQLAAAGVHAGTRVVIAQSRRGLWEMPDHLAGYFMDNRVSILIAIQAARLLRERGQSPAGEVHLVMTCGEEGAHGQTPYAAATIPGDVALAVDVAPAVAEYAIDLSADPVVVFADRKSTYTRSVCNALLARGRELGNVQCATLHNYSSDASNVQMLGHSAQSGLLCIPTENTHGYEIICRDGIARCAEVLAAYLVNPVA